MWKTLLSVALCEWSKQNISNNLKLLYSWHCGWMGSGQFLRST
jgi:hypothetical protein